MAHKSHVSQLLKAHTKPSRPIRARAEIHRAETCALVVDQAYFFPRTLPSLCDLISLECREFRMRGVGQLSDLKNLLPLPKENRV